ncbi:energy transducer TonB [Mesorhizobium sp. M1B.F.Ca.ET.045.04.1.1]|uniref:energy transducer TonB family protein n=1 Tax=Mesorhizobium sp. M1B.F.Ca.ET.045.04.1.1 TaxID=2493673 RepID=UPI000F757B57|nr:energy transducer TonB [Mesorhizobium sp. M1B.F.Ca.ET.045.04.1.1]AZO32527.1 energy transducer TonB [Mesorhizobium sp. M1B.F.Ca.ET.045.04.1.1]
MRILLFSAGLAALALWPGPSEAKEGSLTPTENAALHEKLASCWTLPAGIDAVGSTPHVEFHLKADGTLDGKPVVHGSNIQLDESAVRAVQKCAPYAELAKKGVHRLTITFDASSVLGAGAADTLGKSTPHHFDPDHISKLLDQAESKSRDGARSEAVAQEDHHIPVLKEKFTCSCQIVFFGHRSEACAPGEWNSIAATVSDANLNTLLDDNKAIALFEQLRSESAHFCSVYVPEFQDTGEYGIAINQCVTATKFNGGQWTDLKNCVRERQQIDAIASQKAEVRKRVYEAVGRTATSGHQFVRR